MVQRYDYDPTRILAVLVLISAVSVVYVGLTATATSESYTEFYVLNPDGQASDYPTSLAVNETGTVLVGVSNAEGQARTYTVILRLGDEQVTSQAATVENGATWERNLTFSSQSPGTKQLQILLYNGESIDGAAEPRQRLHLWVEVGDGAQS